MIVELTIEKVAIVRDAPINGIEKEKRATLARKGDRADVHLLIKADIGTVSLTLPIPDYASLDDAVEKAREVVLVFARELAKAAERSPLK
jgi:hypothetical protein